MSALRSRSRAASEAARNTRERERIWQVSEDLLGVANFEGYLVRVNPAWTALLGWSEEEIKRLRERELVHPDDAAHTSAGRAQLATGTVTVRVENRLRHKDGSWRWLSWTMTADAGLIYVIGRNITSQKEAAEKLRESELHFRLLVEGVTDCAIYMLDPHGIVSSWNSGAQRIKGYSEDEILGKHFSQFYTAAERAAGVPDRALARVAAGNPYEAEGWRVRKDGSQFWASVTLSAIRNRRGELVGFAKITRDVTERRQAQEALERVQERLAQSQKLETLGQFTGAIAHDFNNMLMVIGGNTQIIRRRLVDPAALRGVRAIEQAAARGEALTRRLLTFSRLQALNPVAIDLRERLPALRDLLASPMRDNIALVYELPDDLWPIKVDVPELELALVNIVVNARDAMLGGGVIQITAANVTITSENDADGLLGDFVSIAISDTGTGIDPAILQRVFEPFFTTKSPNIGTGLGLSQVYGFVHQSNGTVLISSNLGAGTTVTLYLPRASQAEAEATDGAREEETKGSNEKILLVEDNPEVQGVTASLLEELGYRVQLAENAADALDQLATCADFTLVFSDIVMPGPMNGVALAQRIREAYPHIAVLLTTGYAPREDLAAIKLPLLRKPYRIGTLSTVLRETIERARAERR
jgi:PAS domain S-box-containing protein